MTLASLGKIAQKVRSKNAGPFWLTIDIFCGTLEAYETIASGLSTDAVAEVFKTEPTTLKRFEIPDLNVLKFSLPRPSVQGGLDDRDMHGASWAAKLSEIELR